MPTNTKQQLCIKPTGFLVMFEMCWKHLEKAFWKFQNVLKSVMHVESILKKSVENYKKACWNFLHISENCKRACWKFQYVLKTVKKHVEKFQNVLKTVMHVVCLKFQHMLKTVMHVQNYVEYFRVCWKHVENFKACWKL